MNKDLDYYMGLDYEIKMRKLSAEEGGGWFAEIPVLPGCMADGDTIEELLANLDEAKKSWIKTSLESGRSIPEPSTDDFSGQLRVRMPKSLHRALSKLAKEENVSLNQFIVFHLAKGIGYRN
ncbi:MAG TPA: type II toxin-antitoxin system HicB family antitoxin [Clostridia bacterium]|nr:type II toxin-antitoxin system HicB family antitoxin [Clostridia bacterium]